MKNNRPKTYKKERVTAEICRIVEEVINYEINDPRVNGNATVSSVVLSKDFSNCKVFVQINTEDKENVMKGLKNASGFVRHIIAETLDMKKTPEISFMLDDTPDKAKRIEELLEKIKVSSDNSIFEI